MQLYEQFNSIEELNKKLVVCTSCDLHKTRTQAVCGRGPINAEVCIIGEAPGEQEDKLGKPFVGKSGKKLDELLNSAGMPRNIFITNIVHCRPPSNRNPSEIEVSTCSLSFLFNELLLVRPKIIIPVGAFASKGILGTTLNITKLAGGHFHKHICNVDFDILPTFHPAYVLRNPAKEKEMLNHLIAARIFLDRCRVKHEKEIL